MKFEEALPALRSGNIIKSENFLYKLYKESLYRKDIYCNENRYECYSFSGYEFFINDWEIVEEKKCVLCEGDGYFYISYFLWLNEYCILKGFRKEQLDSHDSKIFKIDCPECCK